MPSTGRTLIRNADAAMYQVKGAGRNANHYYTSDLHERALELLSMESAMRRAIELQEFSLYYQPQIDIVVSSVRLWASRLSSAGIIQSSVCSCPAGFIPIAEERGLIVPIGNWVIEEASRQAAAWSRLGIDLPVSINVSAVQFRQKHFAERLAESVRENNIDARRLELELTESVLMRDVDSTPSAY